MKIAAVFFCIIIVPVYSASFFDEFRGAMSSIEDSFGKLVSDVVTDVSETIGCTILAVKEVLSLNPVFHESSDYDKRCRGSTDQSMVPEVENSYTSQTGTSNDNKQYLSDGLSRQIKESITQAKETGLNLINKYDSHKEIKAIGETLKKENNNLIELSNIFRREFDRMPSDIRKKFGNMKSSPEKPTFDSIWHDVKILHNIDHNKKDSQKTKEIRRVLDEALGILNIDNVDSNASNDEKIKTIIRDLENQSSSTLSDVETQFVQWEKEEHKENNNIKDVSTQDAKREKHKISLAFKDFSLKMTDDENGEQTAEKSSKDSIDINDFLHSFGKDSVSTKEEAEDATAFIENNKRTNMILQDYFAKNKDAGVGLFDNPELFNFD
ncbi:uncharacterized protein LOC113515607 [Galleria mellonella]|uniref:Uncharacterized protein LOC113515607 n=1 Tax=Galleria mellonella TaxID=7137 RepID=A0A6J1WLC4_GALME|nr:uncharacterized protein LOC113515607 [Galleria mellonella]